MPVSRSVSLTVEASRGQGVWALLCRTALLGVDLAAQLLGIEESAGRVEGADLLVGYGVTPPPGNTPRSIDWAKLGELERGWVAREVKGAVSR
jgi:hypothetical protein